MKVTPTPLEGVFVVEPKVHRDSRGHFLETYHEPRYRGAGIATTFVQDNLSVSEGGVLRGLHLQHPNGQAKLVSALRGAIFDVAADIRVGSPTFGRWFGTVLSEENYRQLFIPRGFAHGFLTLTAHALLHYKCDGVYDRASEMTVKWDDPTLAIEWPKPYVTCPFPQLSDKDLQGVALTAIPLERLPRF